MEGRAQAAQGTGHSGFAKFTSIRMAASSSGSSIHEGSGYQPEGRQRAVVVSVTVQTGAASDGVGEILDSPASRSEGSSRGDLFVLCCGFVV
jgi:hypothetical protein